ncbi:MAG: hypothetical protein KTR31_39875 [Myxococcales bacterium]|nr:hypothetical protein [Myxococcales bacterium]
MIGGWLWLAMAMASDPDPLLDSLTAELERTRSGWGAEADAPYFLGYRLGDVQRVSVSARYGQLLRVDESAERILDVSVRVGSPERDSSHALRGDFVAGTNFHLGRRIPLDGDERALRVAVWDATHKAMRDAQERWLRVAANQVVKVREEDDSADFSVEEPSVYLGEPASLEVRPSDWTSVLQRVSTVLDDHPEVFGSSATLDGMAQTTYVVTTEGTRIRQPRTWLRVALSAHTVAEDGARIRLYRWKDVSEPSRAPDEAALLEWASQLRSTLVQMRAAPQGEPYSGPVLLRGRAAGVFVHEVIGHRAEGHRQKLDDEGQTFKGKVGQRVMLPSVSIFDDPTLSTYAGEDLNGHYRFDEEGMPGRRVSIVERGVFRGFLMSRSPIEGFPTSNGHGRAQPGRLPVSRMANTVVQTTDPRSEVQLRRRMRQLLRAQGRSWGLLVDEIAGGFTLTGRVFPNAFNVRAVTAFKVFADGRPDERIRGVDLVGTPLVALSNVVAVGNDPAVFNGFCGAESGSIPNSAVSPSLLISTLEVQLKDRDADRPPLLPKPIAAGDT